LLRLVAFSGLKWVLLFLYSAFLFFFFYPEVPPLLFPRLSAWPTACPGPQLGMRRGSVCFFFCYRKRRFFLPLISWKCSVLLLAFTSDQLVAVFGLFFQNPEFLGFPPSCYTSPLVPLLGGDGNQCKPPPSFFLFPFFCPILLPFFSLSCFFVFLDCRHSGWEVPN